MCVASHHIRCSEFTWSENKRVLRSIDVCCVPSDPPLGIHMVGKQESIKKYRCVWRAIRSVARNSHGRKTESIKSIDVLGVALLSLFMPLVPPLGIHVVGKQESIKKYRGVAWHLRHLYSCHQIRRSEFTWSESKRVLRSIDVCIACHQIRCSELTWSERKRVLRSIDVCGVPSGPPLGIHVVGKQESIKKYRCVHSVPSDPLLGINMVG